MLGLVYSGGGSLTTARAIAPRHTHTHTHSKAAFSLWLRKNNFTAMAGEQFVSPKVILTAKGAGIESSSVRPDTSPAGEREGSLHPDHMK